jgi:hypothetical protein
MDLSLDGLRIGSPLVAEAKLFHRNFLHLRTYRVSRMGIIQEQLGLTYGVTEAQDASD